MAHLHLFVERMETWRGSQQTCERFKVCHPPAVSQKTHWNTPLCSRPVLIQPGPHEEVNLLGLIQVNDSNQQPWAIRRQPRLPHALHCLQSSLQHCSWCVCEVQPFIKWQGVTTGHTTLVLVGELTTKLPPLLCNFFYFAKMTHPVPSPLLSLYCWKLPVRIVVGSVALMQAVILVYWLSAALTTSPSSQLTQTHTHSHTQTSGHTLLYLLSGPLLWL